MSLAKQNWFRKIRYRIRKMLPPSVAEKLIASNERLKGKSLREKYLQNGFYSADVQSPARFLNFLQTQPEHTVENELRALSSLAAEDHNHNYYDALLQALLPEWDLKYDSAEFVGEGKGGSSLNAFRKIKVGREVLFEKVYFSRHRDLKAVLHVDKLAHKPARIPPIERWEKGQLLTVVYFEFKNLNPIKNTSLERELISLSKEFISFSLGEELPSEWKNIEELTAFENHFEFKRNRKAAGKRLRKSGLDINRLIKAAEASPAVFTHGDLQSTNVYENATVVDWDSFGVFPVGMEVAYLFFCAYVKTPRPIDISQWLVMNYKELIRLEIWRDFERNFYFFLYVFSALYFAKGQAVSLEKEILTRLNGMAKNL